MSATIGTLQPRARSSATMFLQVGRVLDRRRGDAHDLAAHRHKVQRLLDALGGVHRVARDHGLHDDRMIAADDDAPARGIADDHFAGFAPAIRRKGTRR